MNKTKFISIICVVIAALVIGISVTANTDNQPEVTMESIPVTVQVTESPEVPENNGIEEAIIPEFEFTPLSPDPEEKITQEILYDRMLNTVDYYDCVTIKYKMKCRESDVEHTESIDSDISKHISYTTLYDEYDQMEAYCDGKNIYACYLNKAVKDYYGPANVRTEYEMEKLAVTPRHSINEYDGYDEWYYRRDITNSISSSTTILPQGTAFLFLSDFEKWEIVGETEYLGRKCVELQGGLSDYAGEKFNSNGFYMCVDKLTGILLKLECYNGNGDINRYTVVSELIIDQPEITDNNIEIGIEKCKAYGF